MCGLQMFSSVCNLAFYPLCMDFHRARVLHLDELQFISFFFFSFVGHAFDFSSPRTLLSPRSQRFSYKFFLKCCRVFHFAFKPMIHVELIFIYSVGHRSEFFF